MNMKPISITDQDRHRLEDLIFGCRANPNGHASNIKDLEREVRRARTVERALVPSNVVTMNSRVRLRDLETDEVEVYTLVYPSMADSGENRISVLAPIGTAIVGSSVGDEIQWPVPAGIRRLFVEDILYQPEQAGDQNL